MDIKLCDYGVTPANRDNTVKFAELISSLKQDENYNLIFEKGDYIFNAVNARNIQLDISLPQSKDGNKDIKEKIAILLQNKNNVTFEGNGAKIIYKGAVTGAAILNCKNVSLKNLTFDYMRHNVSEFAVIDTGVNFAIIKFNLFSFYRIENGKLIFFNSEGDFEGDGLMLEYNPDTNSTTRMVVPPFFDYDFLKNHIKAETLFDGLVKITFSGKHRLKKGFIYMYRLAACENNSFFIENSENTVFENLNVNFMHGSGMVCRISHGLTIKNCNIIPNSKLYNSAFSDMVSCLGCMGKIEISGNYFDGAFGDAVNVHGVNTKLILVSKNRIRVRFMEKQYFGLDFYKPGDTIEFINLSNLLPIGQATVIKSVLESECDTTITLSAPVKLNLFKDIAVSNLSANCDLTFTDNKISNIPARGIAVSTKGKIEISNNIFYRTGMNTALISNDAKPWSESGSVIDVTINSNTFDNCAEPVISILPESKNRKSYINKNIKISDNTFILSNKRAIQVNSTENLLIFDNSYSPSCKKNVIAKNCKISKE